jgi:hypothetical protein
MVYETERPFRHKKTGARRIMDSEWCVVSEEYSQRVADMNRRVQKRLQREPVVFYSAYRLVDSLPVDNLDEVAAEGKILFVGQSHTWSDPGYISDEIVDPTWLDAAALADDMIRSQEKHDHVFLEDIRLLESKEDIRVFEFIMGP